MAGLRWAIALQHTDMSGLSQRRDRHERRLDRIDKRLELAECPIPGDYVPRRSYPLVRACGALDALVKGPDVGDCVDTLPFESIDSREGHGANSTASP